MVKLALFLKATLVGISGLGPQVIGEGEEAEYYYSFQVQCSSCRETHPNHVQVSRHERSDMSGSRGDANFVWKCRNCGRESSANLDGPVTPYTAQQSGKKASIITFETRGCEFVGFRADGEWVCHGTEGKKKTPFEGVDLSEGEWYDYDDSAGAEVSITEIEWSVGRA